MHPHLSPGLRPVDYLPSVLAPGSLLGGLGGKRPGCTSIASVAAATDAALSISPPSNGRLDPACYERVWLQSRNLEETKGSERAKPETVHCIVKKFGHSLFFVKKIHGLLSFVSRLSFTQRQAIVSPRLPPSQTFVPLKSVLFSVSQNLGPTCTTKFLRRQL